MTFSPFPILITLFLIFSAVPGAAQDADESVSGGSQSPHVHGHSGLFVVLEGPLLDIHLQSPAINLLGFEHRATDPEQLAKVERTKKTLTNADALFQLDSGHCQLTSQETDFSAVLARNKPHQNRHGGDEHHEDADEAPHRHSETGGHRDIEAYYRYHCERPGQLRSLTTTLSAIFPGIESLEVQWIVNNRQGAATLNSNQRQLNFI